MRVSLVISTYNAPASLRRCLLGFLVQTHRPAQVIVADDGSTADTAAVLRSPEFASLAIEHVWQPDLGWRKSQVMNLALAHCRCDYVVVSDGDCIPRRDFVAAHVGHARPRTFLSGAMINLPPAAHTALPAAAILDNSIFTTAGLAPHLPQAGRYGWRLAPGRWEGLLNRLTARRCVLRGSNFSAWRQDLLEVNGFDESFVYGKEDRELGLRLHNAGVASRWLKYSLVQLHLDHARGWVDLDRYHEQRRRLRALRHNGVTRVEPGIDTAIRRTACVA
jgi:glycosyltransferase involved in cell wall biosynthesis